MYLFGHLCACLRFCCPTHLIVLICKGAHLTSDRAPGEGRNQ